MHGEHSIIYITLLLKCINWIYLWQDRKIQIEVSLQNNCLYSSKLSKLWEARKTEKTEEILQLYALSDPKSDSQPIDIFGTIGEIWICLWFRRYYSINFLNLIVSCGFVGQYPCILGNTHLSIKRKYTMKHQKKICMI